jgi:hypothetical protein
MNHNHDKQFTATDLLNDLVTNGRAEKQNKSIEEVLLLTPEMLVIAMDYIMSEFDYKKSMGSSTAIGLRIMAAATVTLIEAIETMPDTVEIQKAKNSETMRDCHERKEYINKSTQKAILRLVKK